MELNVAHRDIKPSNILISNDGRCCLCDFGMSKIVKTSEPTYTKFVGARIYMSPEMLNDITDSIDFFLSDIYSTGVTMIECAYGFYPIPMVDDLELTEHLTTWQPSSRRPRTRSCENLADIETGSEDTPQRSHTYMERDLNLQPFEILQYIDEENLRMLVNAEFWPVELSKFVNKLAVNKFAQRPSYDELISDEYFQSLTQDRQRLEEWVKRIMSLQ